MLPLLAPVMMATASSIVWVLGLISATRAPRRWTWIRSASSNTLGMSWLIKMTALPVSRSSRMSLSTWPVSRTPSAAVGSSITDGPGGACLFRAGSAPVRRPGHPVRVADTIGAGDAFTAGLLGGLSRRGLRAPGQLPEWPSGALAEAVEEAVLISALTCQRVGADPPFARGAPLRAADLSFGQRPAGPS
jgi:hypothetical protein